jgi:hypothetical protein
MLTAVNKQQSREFCRDFLQFVQQYTTATDCLLFSDDAHFHPDGFANKQNTRLLASENPNRVVETSLHSAKCTVWFAINKQVLIGSIFVDGTLTNYWLLQQLQNEVISVAEHADTFFQHAHTQRMFGSRVLSNRLRVWPPRSPDMNPCIYFLWDFLKDHVYGTNRYTVQELQAETEAVTVQITGGHVASHS